MAIVIERVESRVEMNVQAGVMCNSCGLGTTAYTETTPCQCGKTMDPYTFDFSQQVPSFVRIRCSCGSTLDCYLFTHTCSCGKDYNWNGDELAPREQWGLETGEHPSECY